MKIKRKGPDKIRITCTNTEAQAIACLFNTACIDAAVRAIWPRTFYHDPYSEYIWDEFRKVGIDSSEIATGKKLKPSGNPETFYSSCALSDLIQRYFGTSKPTDRSYPIPVESTKNLPVSKGEREVLRQCRRFQSKTP